VARPHHYGERGCSSSWGHGILTTTRLGGSTNCRATWLGGSENPARLTSCCPAQQRTVNLSQNMVIKNCSKYVTILPVIFRAILGQSFLSTACSGHYA